MRVILDTMGGDGAPKAPLEAAAMAVSGLQTEMLLCGDEEKLRALAKENHISLEGIDFLHTTEAITMEDAPSDILRERKSSSMGLGLQALKDGRGDAFVSAGNSGALLVGATMVEHRIHGVSRAAMAPILPTAKGHVMLLDGGANLECRPEMLEQFGLMGSIYMEKIMGVAKPRVGLINNGAEECKGRALEQEAYALLKDSGVCFIGNIEAREIPEGAADVVVTDGFTGNIVLKLYEGMGKFFSNKLKEMFTGVGKLGALFIMNKLNDFRETMDYKKVGGAVLLGVAKPVIKAHGSSDKEAFYHAIEQAKRCAQEQVAKTIEEALAARAGKEDA